MGFAAVARVTTERWIACSTRDTIHFGLKPGGDLNVETTICHEIRQHREAVVIDDIEIDSRYCAHPTPRMYGFRSYISVPIVLPDGSFFGTLCAIDPEPRALKAQGVLGMFKLFAELIAFHLDAHGKLAASEARLSHEIEVADLREQFIAVLGHDLRNPLASIDSGARLLLRQKLDDKAVAIVHLMQNSTLRMSGLISDVLDFARGRLGGGFNLSRNPEQSLQEILQQVIDELRANQPARVIETTFSLHEVIDCDRGRIAQLLSNLLGNALTHGLADSPVRVCATTENGWFELSVINIGEPIPPEAIGRLFQPYFRAAVRPSQQGLGLGLYIAAEIARAHGGTLDVTSTDAQTCFTFRMPASPQHH